MLPKLLVSLALSTIQTFRGLFKCYITCKLLQEQCAGSVEGQCMPGKTQTIGAQGSLHSH